MWLALACSALLNRASSVKHSGSNWLFRVKPWDLKRPYNGGDIESGDGSGE